MTNTEIDILVKDAAFVLDAKGRYLMPSMIKYVLHNLGIKEGYRYVSAYPQQLAYMMETWGIEFRPDFKRADDGAEWVTRLDYPPDVLLIESGGRYGLIKSLQLRTFVDPGAEGLDPEVAFLTDPNLHFHSCPKDGAPIPCNKLTAEDCERTVRGAIEQEVE